MTKLHLMGLAKVRRRLTFPVVGFTVLNTAIHVREFGANWLWQAPLYVLFDSALWIGVAFLAFAVVERRQARPRQPRIAAMALAVVCISALSATILFVRAVFESIVLQRPFLATWLEYLPGGFFRGTFYVAIVTGIGYALYSWAVEDHRLAEAAEVDAAIARAELKAAAGRLQPELLNVALGRLSGILAVNARAGQRLIADLGGLLHYSLVHPQSELVELGEELDYLERYFTFQRAILPGPINVSIAADARARSRRIPNLAVLALVQKAITQSTHSRIDISIAATTDADVVRITVSERVLPIAGQPARSVTADFRDVRDRLRRFCGDGFELRVAPHPDGEWKVELELPAA